MRQIEIVRFQVAHCVRALAHDVCARAHDVYGVAHDVCNDEPSRCEGADELRDDEASRFPFAHSGLQPTDDVFSQRSSKCNEVDASYEVAHVVYQVAHARCAFAHRKCAKPDGIGHSVGSVYGVVERGDGSPGVACA